MVSISPPSYTFSGLLAARMESTGMRNRIQISQATADLLIAAGKSQWVKPREDAVMAKGKGVLSTFWLTPNTKRISSTGSVSDADGTVPSLDSSGNFAQSNLKQDRLINWIVDILHHHIRKIVAQRSDSKGDSSPLVYHPADGRTPLDEVAEVINLPNFDAEAVAKGKNYTSVQLDPIVCSQLHTFVEMIASMYRNNAFHNFEHACHVTMAVNKLLKRIVTPEFENLKANETGDIACHLHNYTHGINSDPLTILAIVFSALIHDVDHRGVSNLQLINEDKEMAELYKNKSVAEQNSVDISWDLLMSNEFSDLRACMFATQAELDRFRQVVVNVVLATDIFDKELNGLRFKRWQKAFSDEVGRSEDYNDLRATIVIEHIIQASDVAHTMQHWHVYCKWNKRLFQEMYVAYQQGRMANDPSKFWYTGEIAFFDNYIIPLARKLKDCNVFGVSSDECLNYALKNRAEWEARGNEVVAEMMEEVSRFGSEKIGASTSGELDGVLESGEIEIAPKSRDVDGAMV